jgi:uncharacterized protein (DUF2141 family)
MPLRILFFSVTFLLVLSCARQGSPSGGPKDEIPPRYLSSTPDTLSLNVPIDLNEIKINFDEYIVLKEQQNNVIVSPPLGNTVNFQPIGTASKTLRVKWNESLRENTTYNINFGNAIQDNNEGNVLAGFHFVFSTGDYIDSLMITGSLHLPSERELPKNLLVGLYPVDSAYNDSIVLRSKPFYVARPDEKGSFKLNYLHEGIYQMVAFNDEVQNLQFDPDKEKIGFIDEPVNLTTNQQINISLFSQRPPYKAIKAEQKAYGHLVFKFSGQPEEVEVKPIDMDFTTSKISYVPRSDSLNFWFNPAIDSLGDKSSRIKFLVSHKDESDTISVVYSPGQAHKLRVDSKQKLGFAPDRNVRLTANYPIGELDSAYVFVFKDSIRIQPKLIKHPVHDNDFTVDFPIELNSSYSIEFYPNAITDFFGETNDTLRYNFSVKSRNEYGHLKLSLGNPPKHPFIIRFLTEKGDLLDEQYTTRTEFDYNYLNPGNYYFQIFIDENENGFWDTGDFFSRKFPEPAFVSPELINVRAMWDANETWVLPLNNENAVIEEEASTDADK